MIRAATPADVPQILAFIRALAVYERAPDAVTASVAAAGPPPEDPGAAAAARRECPVHEGLTRTPCFA